MADIRTMKLNLLADVSQFGKSLTRADQKTQSFSKKIGGYSKTMAKSFAVAGAAAAGFAAKLGLDAVKAASDLQESVSKVGVIFGKSADEINEFAEGAATALGLSKQEALDSSATFATLGKAAGLTGKDLTAFSKKSVTLASDLGSFYNTGADEAINAIGSALRGEAEPIRKYGVLISEAALDQAALNYENRTGETLERDKKNKLTDTSKVLARYQAILDQTADAQGDFSRTSDGLAGSQKILNAELDNLKATMGEKLIPFMKDVVEQAGYVAKAFAGKDAQGLSQRARELAGTYDGQGGSAYNLGLALSNIATAFGNIFAALNSPNAKNSSSVLQSFADAVNAVAGALDRLAGVKDSVKSFQTNSPIGRALTKLDDFVLRGGKPKGNAAGGTVMRNQVTRVGEFGPELFVPSGVSGSIRPGRASGGTTVININGVLDAASARKSIERVLQTQSRISGPINLSGAMP